MILYGAVRLLGVVLIVVLLGAVFVLSTKYGWTQTESIVALLGVCAFAAWWDWAVVRPTR